jgi:dTDP-4-amino-4,6-dideoxygalactose transaminase
VFKAYTNLFSTYDWAQLPPQDQDGQTSSYHLYALRIKNITEHQRDRIMEEIAAQGVSVNVHFQPLPLLTVFKDRGFSIADFPVAFDNYAREISLPIYPELDQEKIDYIVKTVVLAYSRIVD